MTQTQEKSSSHYPEDYSDSPPSSKKNDKEKHSNMPKPGSNKIHSPSLSPAERECEITMSTGLGQYNEQGGRIGIGREKGLEYY